MTESLATFQSRLGRALRGEDTCPIDPHSPGFRFTMRVRRSWCESRSIAAARAVLKLMPDGGESLVSEYVDQDGGLAWFQATESERFLSFLASRLPDPSHALAMCRMSQALAQARRGALTFVSPGPGVGARPVVRGRHAALVWFYADPSAVMMALNGGELPPLGPPSHPVLFAPGIPSMFRIANEAEVRVWNTLAITEGPPALVEGLLMEGVLTYPA
jgi:hypothetical protein